MVHFYNTSNLRVISQRSQKDYLLQIKSQLFSKSSKVIEFSLGNLRQRALLFFKGYFEYHIEVQFNI